MTLDDFSLRVKDCRNRHLPSQHYNFYHLFLCFVSHLHHRSLDTIAAILESQQILQIAVLALFVANLICPFSSYLETWNGALEVFKSHY